MPQQNVHQNIIPPLYVNQQHILQQTMLRHSMPQAPIPQQIMAQHPMLQHTMPQQLMGQQAIYPQQPHQFTSMSIPHMPSYMNAPAVCCYNIHGPATNCVSSYQVPPGQHFSGYGSSTQPPIQAQPHFYHNAAMMHYPPPHVPPVTQNTVQTVPTANMPNPQPLPQHGSYNTRLPNTIPMIDLSTGRDRLSEMREQQQSKDGVSVVEEFDHPPNHELVQVYQLPAQAVQLRIYVVQANKLQPTTKEEEPGSLANEVTPVTSSITDIVETAKTNKTLEDGKSPQNCYYLRQQEKDSHDTKEQVQDALSVKKDSLISGNFNNEEIEEKDLMVDLLTNNDIAENSQCDESKKSMKKDQIEAKIALSVNLTEEDAIDTTTSVMQSSVPDLGYCQWTPWKNLLLARSKYQGSLKRPNNLPGDILKMDQARVGDINEFNMGNNGSTDFAPNFDNNSCPNKSSSQRGAIAKRKSPLGSNGKAGGPNNTNPPVAYTVSLKNDNKLNEADNEWKPAPLATLGDLIEDEKKTAELYIRFREILNKPTTTPQNFDALKTQVQDLNIDTSERLQGIINLVFEKAAEEPKCGSMYSSLCWELAVMQVPLHGEGQAGFANFKNLLFTRCQEEFEKSNAHEKLKSSKLYEIENCFDSDKRSELQTELKGNESQFKRKYVGTIRFMGELFKQEMISVSNMLRCLKELLQNKSEESLECLCTLLAIAGESLSKTKQSDLNMILNEMRDIVDKRPAGISSRIRFMLQDSIVLGLSSWVPRRLDDSFA